MYRRKIFLAFHKALKITEQLAALTNYTQPWKSSSTVPKTEEKTEPKTEKSEKKSNRRRFEFMRLAAQRLRIRA